MKCLFCGKETNQFAGNGKDIKWGECGSCGMTRFACLTKGVDSKAFKPFKDKIDAWALKNNIKV